MKENLKFIPNEEEVLGCSSVSFSCNSNSENNPCLVVDVSNYPQQAVNRVMEHLKKNPNHIATIKKIE